MNPLRLALTALLVIATASLVAAQGGSDDLLARENLGGIKVGMAEKALVAILDKAPINKSPSKGENREDYETWDCPEKGLSFEMSVGEDDQGRKVSGFTASGTCLLATAAGIKIGSTLEEVRKAYGTLHENGPGEFFAGNAADAVGLFFTIKDGKVSVIFFGVAA